MAVPVVAAVGSALTGAVRTSSPVPVPAGVASGDVVLVHLYLETSAAVTAPAGFTEVAFSPAPQTTSPVTVQRVFWKRASAADTGTYAFTHASAWTSGGSTRYTGAVASGTPVEVLASAQRASSATVTPTVSASTAGPDRLLVYGATVGNSSEWNPPTGFTEIFDPPGDESLIAAKSQAAAGATGPLAASSTSSSAQTVTLIAVIPASVSTDTTPPSAPSNLVATATGSSTVSLTWDPATDNIAVVGYTVTRNGSTAASGITGTSYGDSGLSASTTYSYTVSAQDAAGNSSSASNTATATTGIAVPASLTVTPTPEPSTTPPRIRLNIADTRSTPAASVTVMRVNPDGTSTPVRTPDGNVLALTVSGSSRTGLMFDYEAPLGVPVSYTTLEAPGSASASVTVDSDRPWLVHPGVPALSLPILVASVGERTRKAQQGVFYPMGGKFPIVHSDGRRKAATYTFEVLINGDAARRSLEALCEDAGTLLLNVPASKGWGIDAEYVSVGDMTEARVVVFLGETYRKVSLSLTVVGRPVGGNQAARTLRDLVPFGTLSALSVAYGSLQEMAAGP